MDHIGAQTCLTNRAPLNKRIVYPPVRSVIVYYTSVGKPIRLAAPIWSDAVRVPMVLLPRTARPRQIVPPSPSQMCAGKPDAIVLVILYYKYIIHEYTEFMLTQWCSI